MKSQQLVPALPSSTTVTGEYLLVQAALPNANIENIGILLLDAGTDVLHCRFRRDFEEFAGEEAPWIEQLTGHISRTANQFGAQNCLERVEETFSNTVRISKRKSITVVDGYAKTADALYAKYIPSNVLRFRTHLPKYSLEAAAGKFGKQMSVEPEGWVEVHTDIPLTDDMFVAHVKGHSMEPQIPDASLCAFRSNIVGSWDGKVLLIEQYVKPDVSRYTVQRFHISRNLDPSQPGDEAWLHQRVTLEPINPAYKSWEVASEEKITALGEFLFVV